MLRPATPLTILFFIAFVLLLLASLSTPVIKGISLGEDEGTQFGVWGFCSQDGVNCSQIEVGYTVDDIAPTKNDFKLNAETRHSASYILIAHPIAALLSLVCTCMAIASHFHGPSHSTRYLLGMFLMTIPTFIASLLAFLIDILLFVPHLKWGSYLVIAATVVILIASILTCGLRRTLSSRKDRRKRIAENAEMSGENYFNRQGTKTIAPARVESPPALSGTSVSPLKEKAMGFGSFDSKPRSIMDDQRPLNPPNNGFRTMTTDAERNGYSNSSLPGRPRDPYGQDFRGADSAPSLLAAGGAAMGNRGRGRYGSSRGFSQRGGSMGGRGGGPYGGPYGPGYSNGNNGYGMRSQQNNPSAGFDGAGRGGYGSPGPGRGGMMGRGPSPLYDIDPYYGSAPNLSRTTSPYDRTGRSNSPSPPIPTNTLPPIESSELPGDGRPGSRTPSGNHYMGATGGMGQLSQQSYVPPRAQWTSKSGTPTNQNSRLSPIQGSPINLTSSTRVDSIDTYFEDVDPRFANDPLPQQSSHIAASGGGPPGIDQLPPALVPGRHTASPGPGLTNSPPSANDIQPLPPVDRFGATSNNQYGPPRAGNPRYAAPDNYEIGGHRYLRPPPLFDGRQNRSFDSLPLQEGQRSPANSDGSHFTSISQRGINPSWRPGFGPKGPGSAHSRTRERRGEEALLDANPDFALPPGRGGFGGGRARGGRGRGSNLGIGSGRSGSLPGNIGGLGDGPYPMPSPGATGARTMMSNDGRYPTPI
ncbi:pali-domain-containing protein [Microthyrium microscopicum]|uniref:Pali-domain-containing protein n=1 Tax=Microthyrium microscopicum TaxID=703497 RepID=A0A6A6UU00_9PEZI|nr:pali-domain-containing protein [Microthyrium microscopicum]